MRLGIPRWQPPRVGLAVVFWQGVLLALSVPPPPLCLSACFAWEGTFASLSGSLGLPAQALGYTAGIGLVFPEGWQSQCYGTVHWEGPPPSSAKGEQSTFLTGRAASSSGSLAVLLSLRGGVPCAHPSGVKALALGVFPGDILWACDLSSAPPWFLLYLWTTKTVILFLYVVNTVEINSLNYIPTGRESACACFAVSLSFLQIYTQ